MLQSQQIEELISLVASLDRSTLAAQFRNYRAAFPLDFTEDFLSTQPLEELRHIFLAICLQSQRMPNFSATEAA